MIAPGSSVKLDILRKNEMRSLTLTLGRMPNERQAKADDGQAEQAASVPPLGLMLSPAGEVAGSGDKGVVVTDVDPNGPAADHGLQTGDVILDVGGKAVANVTDVRTALTEAQAQGKHDVLMRVKTGSGTRFVAMPLSNA
jgi:serine protease Do